MLGFEEFEPKAGRAGQWQGQAAVSLLRGGGGTARAPGRAPVWIRAGRCGKVGLREGIPHAMRKRGYSRYESRLLSSGPEA